MIPQEYKAEQQAAFSLARHYDGCHVLIGWQNINTYFIIWLQEMAESGYIVVLITAGSYEEAHKIAEVLVSQRRVACVNIVSEVNSLFWWQGKVLSLIHISEPTRPY